MVLYVNTWNQLLFSGVANFFRPSHWGVRAALCDFYVSHWGTVVQGAYPRPPRRSLGEGEGGQADFEGGGVHVGWYVWGRGVPGSV